MCGLIRLHDSIQKVPRCTFAFCKYVCASIHVCDAFNFQPLQD